jgi:hypothetical protein
MDRLIRITTKQNKQQQNKTKKKKKKKGKKKLHTLRDVGIPGLVGNMYTGQYTVIQWKRGG